MTNIQEKYRVWGTTVVVVGLVGKINHGYLEGVTLQLELLREGWVYHTAMGLPQAKGAGFLALPQISSPYLLSLQYRVGTMAGRIMLPQRPHPTPWHM